MSGIRRKDLSYPFVSNRPSIMGILNVTPDSFSDGGTFFDTKKACDYALKMKDDGADIVDIGGESTRPGALRVSLSEELERVIPVISSIRKHSDIPISIDTTKSEVARLSIEAGANMINDISSGLFDNDMLHIAANANVPICLMHIKGTPKTMQVKPIYEDLIGEIKAFLADACLRAKEAGIRHDNIVIDPGIGFGKSAEDNIFILKNLKIFKELGYNILIGTSNKSFIGRLLNLDVNERLEATLATLSYAYKNGATIFRVHNVGAARRYLSTVQILEG